MTCTQHNPQSMPDNKLSIEQEYQKYLKMVRLKESEMHEVQRIETKRAFYGACGQMLVMLRDKLSEDPEESVRQWMALEKEVADHFKTYLFNPN